MRTIKLSFITLCLCVFVYTYFGIFPIMGYSTTSPFYTHITFMFIHATIFHLAINLFAFYKLYDAIEKKLGSYALWLPLVISFLASFICEYKLPTVGSSGIVFAMAGIFFALYILKRESYIINAIIFPIGFILGYCTNVNIELHFTCMVIGFLVGLLINNIQSVNRTVEGDLVQKP